MLKNFQKSKLFTSLQDPKKSTTGTPPGMDQMAEWYGATASGLIYLGLNS